MTYDETELTTQVARRQAILDKGVGIANLDEYNVLTLKLAEAVPELLKEIAAQKARWGREMRSQRQERNNREENEARRRRAAGY